MQESASGFQPGFFIIGIEVRTNNSDEGSGNGKIGGMWQKFYAEDVLSRIPGKVGADVLAMYTNYESDVTGEYSFILGAEVNSLAAIPEGMVGKETVAVKYAVFTSGRGAIPGIIIDVWKRIWDSVGSSRSYQADYEVYGSESRDRSDAQVEVWVSVK